MDPKDQTASDQNKQESNLLCMLGEYAYVDVLIWLWAFLQLLNFDDLTKISTNICDVSYEFHDVYEILVRAVIVSEVLESFQNLEKFNHEQNRCINCQDA